MEAFLKRRFIYAGNTLILSDQDITNITTHLKQDRLKYRKYKVLKNMKHIQESIIGRKGAPIPGKIDSVSDLEMGDIVIFRDWRTGIVNSSKERIIGYWDADTSHSFSISFYDRNLCYNMNESYDIMEVWRDQTGKLPRKYNEVSKLSDGYILKFLRELKHMIPKYNMAQIYKKDR